MQSLELEKFGLTHGEAKVYLALLEIGKSTIGKIIKHASVSNSKIYDILDRLNKKGLIGTIIENNRKSFEAKSPDILKDNLADMKEDLKNKQIELNKMLPSLQSIYSSHKVQQEAEILQGNKGIKSFISRLIGDSNKDDTVYVLGAPKEASEKINPFLKDWHKQRIKKGVKCRILYNYHAKKWADKRKLALTEFKFLPEHIKNPVAIDISNNLVGTLVFGASPLVFLIKNSDVAANYRTYFDLLWKISGK